MMLYLVCYDIENDSIRLKIANRLITHGFERVQKSVFIGLFDSKGKLSFKNWIETKFSEDASDSILLIPIPQSSINLSWNSGRNKVDWEYLSGTTHTLML